MTHSPSQPAPTTLNSPHLLRRSGIYRCQLRPNEEKHAWLAQQFPAEERFARTYLLMHEQVTPKAQPWGDSVFQASNLPFDLVVDLSDLPGLAVEALARFVRHPSSAVLLHTDAPSAWLLPDDTALVALPSGEYAVDFQFVSSVPLFHPQQAMVAALERAILAEERTVRLETELKSALQEVQMLSDKYGDYGGQ